MSVCYDTFFNMAVFAHTTIRDGTDFHNGSESDPGMIRVLEGHDFGLSAEDITTLFESSYQSSLLTNMTGSSEIDSENFYQQARLIPDYPFLPTILKLNTEVSLNQVPLTNRTLMARWFMLQLSINDFFKVEGVPLELYSGTYGVVNISDSAFYLKEDQQFPVPALVWQVLHNPSNNSSVAFIFDNRLTNDTEPERICTDVCDQIEWMKWNNETVSNITVADAGDLYCCTLEDAMENIPSIPPLEPTTTLLDFPEGIEDSYHDIGGMLNCTCTGGSCGCDYYG